LLAFRSPDDVRIVETDTGKQIRRPRARYIAFGPDDRLVRVVGGDGDVFSLAVTDPRTRDVARTISFPPSMDGRTPLIIVFDPAGARMAVRLRGSRFDYIAQFDYATGRLAAPVIQVPSATTPAGQYVSDIAYSEDATHLRVL
jgi:hypothetical protein